MQTVIADHGWMVQAVEGTRTRPPFAYTVGLTGYRLPELVVTGKRAAPACSLLNVVAGHVLGEAPVEVQPGEVMHLGPVRLEAVHVPHPAAHLFVALELYGPAVRAVQMVWYDDRGRSPWEVGHRAGRGGQPVLGPRSARRAA